MAAGMLHFFARAPALRLGGFGATLDDARADALAELRYDLEDEYRAAMDKTYAAIERETTQDVHEECATLGLVAFEN